MTTATETRKLVRYNGYGDQVNTFRIVHFNRVLKRDTNLTVALMQGYDKQDDGIFWGMQIGAMVKAHYTEADRAESHRLMTETPVRHGDVVEIEGKMYRVNVLGDYSNAAVFEEIV